MLVSSVWPLDAPENMVSAGALVVDQRQEALVDRGAVLDVGAAIVARVRFGGNLRGRCLHGGDVRAS